MKKANHHYESFRLKVLGHMLLPRTDSYYNNNWLKAEIALSGKDYTKKIRLELLQCEELTRLKEWMESLLDRENRREPLLDFLDGDIEFRVGARDGKELIRFVYYTKRHDNHYWAMDLNPENIRGFNTQIQEIITQYPLR
jgi:hypothetical protein